LGSSWQRRLLKFWRLWIFISKRFLPGIAIATVAVGAKRTAALSAMSDGGDEYVSLWIGWFKF
jgi:hypothetical protein